MAYCRISTDTGGSAKRIRDPVAASEGLHRLVPFPNLNPRHNMVSSCGTRSRSWLERLKLDGDYATSGFSQPCELPARRIALGLPGGE